MDASCLYSYEYLIFNSLFVIKKLGVAKEGKEEINKQQKEK